MKKRMSRILSILLVSALVVSAGDVVQAEETGEPAAGVQAADEPAEPEEKQPEETEEKEPEEAAGPVEEVKEKMPAADSAEKEKAEKKEVKEEEKKEEPAAQEVQNEEALTEEAAEEPEPEAELIPQKAAEATVLETMNALDAAKEMSAKAVAEGSIPLNRVVTGAETEDSLNAGAVTYGNTSAYKKGGNDQYGYGEAVSLTKGTLLLTVGNHQDSTHSIYFGLYKDSGLTQPVDSYASVAKGSTGQRVFKVPANGTYYIGVYSNVYSSTAEGTAVVGAGVVAQFCDGSDRTLTSGKQVAVGVKDSQTTYFKFKATKTGYIKAIGDKDAVYYNVALLNSSKKALSGDTYLKYNPTYGVTKGKTYYIRVKSSYNTTGFYSIKVTNNAIKEKSGKNKKKSVTVKKGATKKGTIQAGSSQADWYKFKKTNTKKITITVKGKTNDKLKITVYKGGKKYIGGSFEYYNGGAKITGKNWPKGTYYIKVERGNKKSSGYYSLNWK